MFEINATHNPSLKSWVVSANNADTDFSIQNLPFAVFREAGGDKPYRGGVAIGDEIIDLAAVAKSSVFDSLAGEAAIACSNSTLNEYMSLGSEYWSALRQALSSALTEGSALESRMLQCLVKQSDVEYSLPCTIGDYTDFYTSINHAKNVGKLFRPDNPLLPNYKWVPIGYHGRASSIQVSGNAFRRPIGQLKGPNDEKPVLAPSKRLDYELELGIFMGQGNALGSQILIDEVNQHFFGACLLNDWSARDIQAWEYQPLGPFLAKNFASTISPWIVTAEALLPFRVQFSRDESDPQPLPYLTSQANSQEGGIDIKLQVSLLTEKMRSADLDPVVLSNSNFNDSYWTIAQMVAHHTVNGCNLNAGDLLGSGTQSGPNEGELGSMLELSEGGSAKITLPNGEQRTFLEDGDSIVLTAWAEKEGMARIGFGHVSSIVLPALEPNKT